MGLLWTYIAHHRKRLGVELTDAEVESRTRAFVVGNPFYLAAIIVSFISPAVVLVIVAGVAVYYMALGMKSPDL